jgi:NarL family two-component system response regulator LiaR
MNQSSPYFLPMDSPPEPPRVRKHVLVYGLLGGVLIALLRFVEFRYLVIEHSVQIYGAIVALIFAGLGIWLGLRLNRTKERVVVREVPVPTAGPFVRNTAQLEHLGITGRELEILELIAEGLSNREIAQRAFVSENTVKTHSKRLFDKLGARRRTQAVQFAKERGLIP